MEGQTAAVLAGEHLLRPHEWCHLVQTSTLCLMKYNMHSSAFGS